MPRRVASLLVVVLIASSARVSALHVHAYTDHDHPEHHHGIADHEHPADAHGEDDDVARIDECEPGEHAVSIAMACAAPTDHRAAGEAATAAVAAPSAGGGACGEIREVRVHGPPPLTHAPPRAPPLIHPA